MTRDDVYKLLTTDKNDDLSFAMHTGTISWWNKARSYTIQNNYAEAAYNRQASLELDYSGSDLRFADLILLFGAPSTAFKCGGLGRITFTSADQETILMATIEIGYFQKRMEANSKVLYLILMSVDKQSIKRSREPNPYSWHGFVQWNKDYRDCGMG
jgi:hypothetical protein